MKQCILAKAGDVLVLRIGGSTIVVDGSMFLRYVDLKEQCHTQVVLRDPLSLTRGKSGLAALFASARVFSLFEKVAILALSLSNRYVIEPNDQHSTGCSRQQKLKHVGQDAIAPQLGGGMWLLLSRRPQLPEAGLTSLFSGLGTAEGHVDHH